MGSPGNLRKLRHEAAHDRDEVSCSIVARLHIIPSFIAFIGCNHQSLLSSDVIISGFASEQRCGLP
jgi:hypothetical protein